jgi:hypothetical protein
MIAINKIFDIRYGNQFDFSKMELADEESAINFISRGSTNNGFVGKVKKYQDVEPFEAGLITVTMGGSYLLASFVQPAPFYTAQNVKVLSPKFDMTLQERLFYCAVIQHNRFRYHSHSREANSTFDNLIVPSREEIPSWINESSIKTNYEAQTYNEIDSYGWKWFRYDEIFDIKKGFYNKKPLESGVGTIPFIGATEANNGITSMHTLEEIEAASKTGDNLNQDISEKIFAGNCITVSNDGSIGFAFYQEKEFTCSHSVNPLYLKGYTLNKYIAMFLCTLIELEQYRWAYGRKWRPKRMPSSLIKLPVKSDDTPDWEFMEKYIKSLPYSANI